jgi:cell division protein FtsI/penicillin-binding protein 2
MFERRLKVLLFILLLACVALAIRAAQIQLLQHDLWRQQATELMKRGEFIETTRGAIFDRNRVPLVDDAPCVDASVDFRAIPEEPNEQWINQRAEKNLKISLGSQYKKPSDPDKDPLTKQEANRIRGDIAAMWDELAAVSGQTPDQIDVIRRDIVQRVEMRKRYIWWRNYEEATARSERENSTSWYRHFLVDSAPDETAMDKFEIEVGEETSPHVILHNISPEIQAHLARQQERFFCLSLVPSKYREYRFGRVGCNVVGNLGAVRPDEVTFDAGFSDSQLQQYWSNEAGQYWQTDLLGKFGITPFRELRKYWPSDLAGRAGIEALCEETLRGTRGKIDSVAGIDRDAGTNRVIDQIDAVPGKDVSLSIDILLQQDIENEFIKTRVHRNTETKEVLETRYNQHGAAVVIKVDTGEVLALVSNPGYDPKDLSTRYADLANDELNRPLLDRATQMDVVPGSTVKPIVGSGAITEGVMTSRDKILCTGELIIGGKPQPYGHCWIYFTCPPLGRPISHGVPGAGDPGIGPDNLLTVSDGLKDSCNVVFENIAMKMTMKKLAAWFDKFGLGRPTGIGIEENAGLIYRPTGAGGIFSETQTWSAGIGEGHIQATPIQMANVAATLARDGVWMRPRLIASDDAGRFTTRPSVTPGPDAVDLHLSPDALQAVQKGMREVCSMEGTGAAILPEKQDPPLEQDPLRQIPIAGKTGSAQTGKLMSLVERDPSGKVTGIRQVNFGDPGTQGWYLKPDYPDHPEKHLAHGWFIGYAPADHPQIAFCVFVEYGEAGGRVAGAIAHDLLVDCVKRGYLRAAK